MTKRTNMLKFWIKIKLALVMTYKSLKHLKRRGTKFQRVRKRRMTNRKKNKVLTNNKEETYKKLNKIWCKYFELLVLKGISQNQRCGEATLTSVKKLFYQVKILKYQWTKLIELKQYNWGIFWEIFRLLSLFICSQIL